MSSVGVQLTGSFDRTAFTGWLSTLLQSKGADIFRSKARPRAAKPPLRCMRRLR